MVLLLFFAYTRVIIETETHLQVIDAVDQSLINMELEYIDLVMIHFPGLPKNFNAEVKPERFCNIPREASKMAEARIEMWEALQVCRKDGKVKHIGVSNFTRNHIEQLLKNPR